VSDDHIKSEISAYLTGGLPDARNRQIEAHAAVCEKCRQALSKARAKQARVKREALKKASADPLPNLFLARQGKEAGLNRPASKAPAILVGALIAAGAAYGLYRYFYSGARPSDTQAVERDVAPVAVSSAPVVVSSAPVISSAPVAAAVPTGVPPTPEVAAPPAPSPIPLEVKQEWKGAESGIKTSRIVVIRNWKSWERLWAEMQGKEPLPSVNFDQYVVVCIFAGERTPNASVHVGRIREDRREVIVSYRVSGQAVTASTSTVAASSFSVVAVSSSAVAPRSGVPSCHPYLLSVIPRVDKKMRITQREIP